MDTSLPDEKGILLETYGNEQFSRDVVQRFAELQEELRENADLLHVQMGTLARGVRSAVSSGDTELPLEICVFLDEALGQPRAVPEIENAVAISFVEARPLRWCARHGGRGDGREWHDAADCGQSLEEDRFFVHRHPRYDSGV